MITMIRWILMKQKKIKWKSAFWQFFDKQMTELLKNPDELETRLLHYLSEIMQKQQDLKDLSS
ncbi:hypothetical protein AALB16_10760 [Lachnospiraceae bacterium 62-35]